MNKSAIQKFAIWARTTLMEQVAQRAYQYGITQDGYGEENAVTVNGMALSPQEQSQRRELVREIQAKGYDQVMEEVAYTAEQVNFSKIPGSPIAYWVSQAIYRDFQSGKSLGEMSKPRQGMATTNNNRFLRLWHEVSISTIGFGCTSINDTIGSQKWYPYNKGGDFRKWYGNNDYVVNFRNQGEEVCAYIDATSAVKSNGRVINREHYFHECISWSLVTSGNIAFRYKSNCIFDVAGMSCFADHKTLLLLLGLNNSNVVNILLKVLAPTINFQVGDIANIPVLKIDDNTEIQELVEKNIQQSKKDWDCYETSWDFKRHPLV